MYKQIVKQFNLVSISIFIGIVTSYAPAVFSEAVIKFNILSFISILLLLASISFGFKSLQYRNIIESKLSEKLFTNNLKKLPENPNKIEQIVFMDHEAEFKKVMFYILAMFIFLLILAALQGVLQKEKESTDTQEHENQYVEFIKKSDSLLSSLAGLSFDVTEIKYRQSLQKEPKSYQNYLQINPLFDNCCSLSCNFISAYCYNSCIEDRNK